MKITLLLMLLIGLTTQQCTQGCLKCSTANACILCDVTNSYYINGTTCLTSTVLNCKVLTQSNTCAVCVNNYYLNPTTSLCVAVPTASIVANCATYSGTFACTSCLGNYFISTGNCSVVTTTVANCASYSVNGVCSACSQGYIFSYNNTLCVAIPSTTNCLSYTYGSCKLCNAGYFLNPNQYIVGLIPSSANSANFLIKASSLVTQALSVCQAVTATNCVTLSSFNICSVCATGYYVIAGVCVVNPSPVIQYCTTYSSLVTCTACSQGYFLSSNACSAIVAIPFCATYSTTASSTQCIACNVTSYVSNNACVNRTNSVTIPNCMTYSSNTDTCATCNSGFLLTSNGLFCYAVVANCLTYATWSVGQTSFTCATCVNTFFLSTATPPVCTAGSISNCITYSSSTACTACANGYYLVGGNTCTQHVTIPNCMTYSQSTANTCGSCNSGFFLFSYYQTCIAGTAVANCLVYANSASTCVTCAAGFYLSGTSCLAIPTAANNCIAYTSAGSGSCTACSSAFVLATIGSTTSCLTPVNYVTANCDTLATWASSASWTSSVQFCSLCKASSIPYSLNGIEAICVLTTDLVAAYVGYGTSGVTNCVRYGLNSAGTNLVCMQCAATFVINNYGSTLGAPTSATTCGASTSCPTAGGVNMILIDDFFGSVNICIPTTSLKITNCQMAGRFQALLNTNADLACFQATTNNVLAYSSSTGFYNFDLINAATTSITNVNGASSSIDFDFGYSTYDTFSANTFPKVFNYRGVNANLAAVSGVVPTGAATNCDIIFSYSMGLSSTGTPGALGSAFSTGGALGAYTPLTVASAACMRCNFGFQPVLTISGSSGSIAVPTCTAMTNCASATTILGGLPSFLNAAFSCHACAATGSTATFPTLAIEYDASSATAKNLFLQYYLRSTTSSGFACAAAPTTVTTLATTPTANNAVANCAAYGIFAAQTGTTRADPTIINNICLACASGYYPFYFGTAPNSLISQTGTYIPNYAVVQCTASANCAASPANSPFNSCGACSTAGLTLTPPVYYGYTDYRLINCLSVSTPNCFILKNSATLSTTLVNGCSVCMTGFFLNADGYCDQLTIPNIGASPAFAFSFYARSNAAVISKPTTRWDNDIVRTHYLLSFFGSQYGASSCASGSALAPNAPQASTFCAMSSYLSTNVVRPSTSIFLTNCLKYSAALSSSPNVYTCSLCSTGNIPVIGGIACVATVANCLFARISPNTATCQICASGYVNLNGVCSNQVLVNCLSYVNTIGFNSATTLTCSVCNNGYTLANNGTCVTGLVANCNTYTNPSQTACTACKTGFLLIGLSGTSYCYPIPSSLNCNLVASNANSPFGFQQGVINCQSCIYSSPSAPLITATFISQTTATLPQNACLGFNAVANCVSYAQTSATLNNNNLACSACSATYFLLPANSTCLLRSVQDPNCLTYVSNADQCATCATGYFVSSTTFACVAFPNGIAFCVVYSNATTCTMCNSGYYLSSNACLLSTVVSNCVVYSANYTCTGCAANYFLNNATSCVSASAANCLTYSSASACATCQFGWQVTTANSISSCTQIVVANCAVLNPATPTNCLFCTGANFVNSAGVCTAVTPTIANCLYYASATTCNNCTAGFTLSPDMTICSNAYTNATDSNCAASSLLGSAACSQCQFGYTFQGGVCTACSLYATGCLICDSNNSTNCLMCRPGYYQVASASCIANPVPSTNVTTKGLPLLFTTKLFSLIFMLFFARWIN